MGTKLDWMRQSRGFPYWIEQYDAEPDKNAHYHVAKSTSNNDQYLTGSVFAWYNHNPIPFDTIEEAKQWCEMHWATQAGG